MKEAVLTDLNGLYTGVAIVSDAESGVTPLYEQPVPDPDADPPAETPEPVLVGYRVAVSVTPGLYLPRFDLAVWETYQDEERQAYDAYLERGDMPVYVPPEQPAFWLEGLTPEEIEALHPPAPETAEEKLARLERENTLLKAQVQAQSSRADFVEDIIAEMAMMIYP